MLHCRRRAMCSHSLASLRRSLPRVGRCSLRPRRRMSGNSPDGVVENVLLRLRRRLFRPPRDRVSWLSRPELAKDCINRLARARARHQTLIPRVRAKARAQVPLLFPCLLSRVVVALCVLMIGMASFFPLKTSVTTLPLGRVWWLKSAIRLRPPLRRR